MVSVQINKSGFHQVNVNRCGYSRNSKRKNFERKNTYSDISVCVASTKRIIQKIIHNQDFSKTSFLTLTFKEDKFSNYSLAVYEFTKFIQRLNYFLYGCKQKRIKYLGVPEKQTRGVWHFHIILFDVPYIPSSTIQDIWGLGFIRINKVNDINHLINYIQKYISKSLFENIEKYKKKILTSKGLDKGFHLSGLSFNSDIQVCLRLLYSQEDYSCITSVKKEFKNGNYVFENLFEVIFSKHFYDEFKCLFSVKGFSNQVICKWKMDLERNELPFHLQRSIDLLIKENLDKQK